MRRILLVDNEEHVRTLVHATLEGPDCEVIEAASGPEAVALAGSRRPDLVVLDWMMPGMTGLEVVRVLRREEATAATPVILLTARGRPEDREEGLAAGATAFVSKPFSPLELMDLIEDLARNGS